MEVSRLEKFGVVPTHISVRIKLRSVRSRASECRYKHPIMTRWKDILKSSRIVTIPGITFEEEESLLNESVQRHFTLCQAEF